MSINVRLSYTDNDEAKRIIKLLKPVLRTAKVRKKLGAPYNRLYFSWPDGENGQKSEPSACGNKV